MRFPVSRIVGPPQKYIRWFECGMLLHEYLLGVGQKAAATAAKTSAAAEMARRRKAQRAAMPAKSPNGTDNVLKPFKCNDMPEAAFLVHHAAAVKALRDSGAPVNYGSVIRESMRSTLDHGPSPPYDPATDTPAHRAWESAVRRRHVLQMLDRLDPDSRTDAE